MQANSPDNNTVSNPRCLYVYYKVPMTDRAKFVAPVLAFAQQLRQRWPGLEVELMQRPAAAANGQETWMEIYRHPAGLSDEMVAAIAQLATEQALPAPRASEMFVPLRG